MKVILIDEVHGLGGRGDVVLVKDGYARNFLLPKKLARAATPGNLKMVEQERKKWAVLAQQEKAAAQKWADQMMETKVVLRKKVGDSGTLYGSVTASDIAEELSSRGFEVDKRRIELTHPIKTLGVHKVEIRVHREVTANVDVEVIGEGGETAAPPAAPEPEPEPTAPEEPETEA